MKKCAILSMDCLDDFESYDTLIEAPLLALGWQTETVSWRSKNVDWNNYHAVIIRTPWDYQDDAPAFLRVLEQIEQSSAHLENNLNIVRWNIDKIYLQDLEKNGVTLVPTLWHQRLTDKQLTCDNITSYFAQLNCQQLIIKPRISANADNTFWLKENEIAVKLPAINSAFANRDYMVQPFMENIITEGEYSLFYFNGQYSHAILKTPKNDDFRVQEEHGGRLAAIAPEAKLVEQATQCLDAIAKQHQMPLYARVDLVRFGEQFALMEAELIEPSLYFNMDNQSAERFAQAFVTRMNRLSL
ncbi:hypothetical protein tinsulaeT_17300 [Thalassotalea insulae]|uniref:Prokaryotic glutathione synthetase ATP-binding domain-containing protein n=1 Tax=Thalassotalea insulae TaxID=2056778 RepID=A0ABQ6GR04_9GAMM|nr:hypothetical protein [Thalassotalea insulae]GLX78390.1 hypothetical protein tinsulaeT_17300 [Thalassotalea insulae]